MAKIKIPWSQPTTGIEELNQIKDSFNNDWLSMGPKVKLFEQQMSEYIGVKHAIAVSNGTVALDIALKTIGIKPEDEVIVPAMTYFATAAAVSYQYATPVFCDIEPESYNLNPDKIEKLISNKTKALIFIDYGGNPAKIDEILEICKKNEITVIQDAAQSLGGVYKSKMLGSQAYISTMSFHAAKVMTTIEGGMIFTNDDTAAEEIKCRRNQGEANRGAYEHSLIGTNARMTDIHAAIGLEQFKKLPRMLEERARIACQYDKIFGDVPAVTTMRTREVNSKNAYFFYPILIPDRQRIALELKSQFGIDTRIAYPKPVYEQPAYATGKVSHRKGDCPVAEKFTKEVLNLPIFPIMTNEMVDEVAAATLGLL